MQTARGIEVLGSPVGNKQFSTDFVMDRIQRKSDLLNEIEQLASHDNKAAAQSALLLLRYCALPAVSHLLRTVPTPLADVAFIHHDDAVLHTVSKLIAPSDPLFRTPTRVPAAACAHHPNPPPRRARHHTAARGGW